MIQHSKCPVCDERNRQSIWASKVCETATPPADIQQAGLNVILRDIVGIDVLHVRLFRCKRCRHMYLDPSFDDDELHNLYSSECVARMKAEFRVSEGVSGRTWFEQHGITKDESVIASRRATVERPAILKELLEKTGRPSPRRILDVGGGDGNLMSAFEDSERYLFDYNPWPGGDERLTRISTDAELSESGPFDFLIMSHVLEHQPYPYEFVEPFLKHLTDDASIYFEVPLEYVGWFFRKKTPPIGAHVNLFCTLSLNFLFARCCIETIESQRVLGRYGEMNIPVIKLVGRKIRVSPVPRYSFFDQLSECLFVVWNRIWPQHRS